MQLTSQFSFATMLEHLLQYLQLHSAEVVSIYNLLFCYLAIIIACISFRKHGLFIYIAVSLIACNLAVLKASMFTGYASPMALGTIIYASTFLASDILAEFYGIHIARKAVLLSFFAVSLMLLHMTFTLGYPLLPSDIHAEHPHFNQAHYAINLLFSPTPALLAASLIAYVSSQLLDIQLFSKIKEITKGRYLWLRSVVAILFATFIDSVIFNYLAFIQFSASPVSLVNLWYHYIFGGYLVQVLVATCNVPIFYFISYIRNKYALS